MNLVHLRRSTNGAAISSRRTTARHALVCRPGLEKNRRRGGVLVGPMCQQANATKSCPPASSKVSR
eukprot:349706-Chlamydomonas_euryale.AAC.10